MKFQIVTDSYLVDANICKKDKKYVIQQLFYFGCFSKCKFRINYFAFVTIQINIVIFGTTRIYLDNSNMLLSNTF